jgi:diadenosine tetraphosphate (Ap4A) HIT family hydrolase
MPRPTSCYACDHAGPDAPFLERIVRGGAWRVAHDIDSSLPGWLILVPERHVQALHELTPAEAVDLGTLLRKASIALRTVTDCVKTYVMLFAEDDGFAHLHVHLVPRMPDQPDDRRGTRIFGYVTEGEPLSAEAREQFGRALIEAWPTDP